MSKKVARVDYFTIQDFEQVQNGYLKVPAYLTRTGVFDYATKDGKVFKELRPDDEVFNDESKTTLSDIPITNDHPAQFLNTRNTRGIAVGYTSTEVISEDNKLKSTLTIYDQDTIDKIVNDGKREISCGYLADLEMTPGEYNGQHYDAIQRNIRYNHVAIVDRGRAGSDVKMIIDGKDATFTIAYQKLDSENKTYQNPNKEVENKQEKTEGNTMLVKIKIDGKEFEVDQIVADSLKKQETEEKEALKAKLDEAEGKVAALEDENKKVKEEFTKEKMMDAAKARIELENTAKKILGDEFKADADDIEIKKSVIAKNNAEIELAEKSEEFVDGVFATIMKSKKESSEKADKDKEVIRDAKTSEKIDENEMSSYDKRIKSIEDDKNAWKSK